MSGWNDFIEATKMRNPIPLLVEAVETLGDARGKALDLGCGAGVDAKYLAENGFYVTAIDINESAIEQTKALCDGLSAVVLREDAAGFEITPDEYDLIMAWNTLPFLNKDNAGKVFEKIQNGLKKDGLLVLGMFGPEDGWAKDHPKMSFWAEAELKEALSQMEFLKFIETKKEGPTATGEKKFWHKLQGIAKKH